MSKTPRVKVKYVPPSLEAIDLLAKAVCEQLAVENPAFRPPEVVQDLAAFLNLIARIQAQRLNQNRSADQPLDRESESE
ncbi:hypothetical protein TFLX_06559 [Thermoflexales bacterium]|nr:hypothetical protein TFLX_06559 [Thermoflexales bacterium]